MFSQSPFVDAPLISLSKQFKMYTDENHDMAKNDLYHKKTYGTRSFN